MDKELLIELLKREMLPAMGCTEPASSALAGAKAREVLGSEQIVLAEVSASRDMIKNAMGVGIPDCSLKGIQAAVALGICGGNTEDKLSILSRISKEQIDKAIKLEETLNLVNDVPPLYVAVKVFDKDGNSAKVAISGEHDRFSYIEKNGDVLLDLPMDTSEHKAEQIIDVASLKLDDIIAFAKSIDCDDVPFIMDAVKINSEIALHSVNGEFGLEVGKTVFSERDSVPKSLADAFEIGASLAAAGSDARMSGCSMPVIINSGSGNQGITVTVPVKIVADYLKCSDRKLVQAVCVSELTGLVLTAKKNRLSALCGAFTASIGTACAWVYLLDGDRSKMDNAVNTMVGNLTGIICDGAKNTCALKIYSCLEAAALSVKLAMKGLAPGRESGIVGQDSLESVAYLSRISSEGMAETDKTIVSIMLNKKC